MPQFAYFSDILQQTTIKGGTLGAEWRWSDSVSSQFNYFYVHEDDESFTYSNKVWFNGQGSAPGSLHPGIDPTQPYTIDANGVVEVRHVHGQRGRNRHAVPGHRRRIQYLPACDHLRRHGPVHRRCRRIVCEGKIESARRPGGRGARPVQLFLARGLRRRPRPLRPAATTAAELRQRQSWLCVRMDERREIRVADRELSRCVRLYGPAVEPGLHDVQVQLGVGEFHGREESGHQGQPAFHGQQQPDALRGRAAGETQVDQGFGRYLIDGATLGTSGVGAGTAAGNCCIAAGQSGTGIYYSDPGLLGHSVLDRGPAASRQRRQLESRTW